MKALKVLLAAILITGTAGSAFAYDPLVNPVSIPGEANLPLAPGPVIDDFNDEEPVNSWRDLTGTFSKHDPPQSNSNCTATYDGSILRLDYDVTQENGFAGYYSRLGSQSISSYTRLSFRVKGAAGGEFFKIELKNTLTGDANKDRNKAAVYVSDFLDGGVTTSWQQVIIPFHNFANINDFSSMAEVLFVFENVQSAINLSPLSGTVYIDDIAIDNTVVDVVRIDHFGDKLGTCSLGGNMGDLSSGDARDKAWREFKAGAGEYKNYPNGLLARHDVQWSWAGFFMLFGGGDTGWTAITHDFSDYNYLTFYIRGWSGGNPNRIIIELADAGGPCTYWLSVPDNWTEEPLKLPLASFIGSGGRILSKSSIKQFNVIYTRDAIDEFSGDRNGGVYIDEVQFEK